MKSYAKLITMATFAVLMLTTFAAAQPPGEHPGYRHALRDLRHARAILERMGPNERVDADEQRAIHEIDAAFRELQEANIGEGEGMNEPPPAEMGTERHGRLRRALELLDQAHDDIDQHESEGFARGLKRRALHHVDEARRAVHHAMDAAHHE